MTGVFRVLSLLYSWRCECEFPEREVRGFCEVSPDRRTQVRVFRSGFSASLVGRVVDLRAVRLLRDGDLAEAEADRRAVVSGWCLVRFVLQARACAPVETARAR